MFELSPPLTLRAMTLADLRQVIPIEREIYESPWTYGNFRDALQTGYPGWIVHTADRPDPIGYTLTMHVLDECHLLNLSVARDWQGRGVGRQLLRWLIDQAARRGSIGMFLEVRPSNGAALALYESIGFMRIGLRRDYYPSIGGRREDAIVMRLPIVPAR
ncbi:MAG: ribosomal protein S18-alanine N-acetyltransferase [Burkholderiaceae bacterium]